MDIIMVTGAIMVMEMETVVATIATTIITTVATTIITITVEGTMATETTTIVIPAVILPALVTPILRHALQEL
jgi:hypothetical protein